MGTVEKDGKKLVVGTAVGAKDVDGAVVGDRETLAAFVGRALVVGAVLNVGNMVV